jgi:tetratricopeptide (TPR) repeat protein
MAALYQAPRDAISPEGKDATPECVEFWNALRGFDLSRGQTEFPDIKAVAKSERCSSVPTALKNLHEHFNKTCGPDTNSTQCLIALYHYRAGLTDFLTRNLKVEQINDPKVLIDKMLANREINPELSVKAAEKLSELEPNLYEARKAQVLGRLYQATKEAPSGNSDVWGRLDEAIRKAKELGNSDPELLEAELMSELSRSNNTVQAQEKAKEAAEDFPNEWRGPYFAAWALFKDGRGQEALDYLVEAQRRDPGNTRVKDALEGIKKGDANPFKGGISFSDLSQYF